MRYIFERQVLTALRPGSRNSAQQCETPWMLMIISSPEGYVKGIECLKNLVSPGVGNSFWEHFLFNKPDNMLD